MHDISNHFNDWTSIKKKLGGWSLMTLITQIKSVWCHFKADYKQSQEKVVGPISNMIVLNTTGCCCCCVCFTVDFHPFTRCFNKVCYQQSPNNPINYIRSVITYSVVFLSRVYYKSGHWAFKPGHSTTSWGWFWRVSSTCGILFFLITGVFVISVFATDILSTILWPCAPRVKKNALMGVIGSYLRKPGGSAMKDKRFAVKVWFKE